ncbi:MAG: penicillin acylase family protein [Dehalococcoidia bacterium]
MVTILRRAAFTSVVIAFTGACAQAEPDLDDLALESLSQLDGEVRLPGLESDVEVIRDQWGIPHIYAETLDDLFFAQGFVQAQDRLWQMEMWRRYNGGRLAEVMGPAAVEHDRIMRLIQYQGPWDDEEFASYRPEGRRVFEAFVAGTNAFIERRRDNLPVEFKLTGITPDPWTLRDAVLRVPRRSLNSALSELRMALDVAELGHEEVTRRTRPDPVIALEVPVGLDLSLIDQEVLDALDGTLPTTPFPRPVLLPEYRDLDGALASLDFGAPETQPGSNNWVLGPERTTTGGVLLSNDPHRQVTNPSLRYLEGC